MEKEPIEELFKKLQNQFDKILDSTTKHSYYKSYKLNANKTK